MSSPEKKKPVSAGKWVVYILECGDHSLYTGITNNLALRLKRHSSGTGARYTRSHLPVSLVYSEKCRSKSAALKRECAIKKLSRAQKIGLITTPHRKKNTKTRKVAKDG